MKLAHATSLNISDQDMYAIVAEAIINRWSITENMDVVGVSQLEDSSFQIELFPKPAQQETEA